MDNIFQNIDKSPNRIPTGLLYEKGYNLIEEDRLLSNNGAPTDYTTWKTMYYSLWSSRVNNAANTFPDLNIVEERVGGSRAYVQIPILRINFNNVNRNAFDKEWLKLDFDTQELFDTQEGLLNKPYETNEAFGVAPAKEEVRIRSAKFFFNPKLFFTNIAGLKAKYIEADFEDGAGFKPYQLGDYPNITWTSNGVKNLKFVVYFNDGTYMKSNSDFKVNFNPELGNLRYASTTSVPPQAISVLNAAGNGMVTGTLNIRYSDGNAAGPIKKPLIVVEGFNPLNDYGYSDFILDFGRGNFSTFNDNLSGVGQYDLIFLDFGDGGASILDNARLFEKALQVINAQKVPLNGVAQKNVVMGISMGGLVARFGLAKIQKGLSNITSTHDTRLLITHDSPHQGASIPAGIQFLGRTIITDELLRTYVKPLRQSIQDLTTYANAPATKEMLAYHTVSTPGNGVGWVLNTFYAQHYRGMVDNVPVNANSYQFIATSQGSECGDGIVGAGADLFNSTGGAGFGILWNTYARSIGYEFNLRAGNGANRVLYFRLYNQRTIWGWFFGGITTTTNMRNISITNPYPSATPLDSQPGGIRAINFSLNVGIGFDIGLISFNASASATSAPGFCFIPRDSALDTVLPTNGPLSGAYSRTPGGFNVSRANSFITQEGRVVSFPPFTTFTVPQNLIHTRFTLRQTAWLFDEMEGNMPVKSQNCAEDCKPALDAIGAQINASNTSISGSTLYTANNTYSASSSLFWSGDAAISYSWSITNAPASAVITGQGSPTITVTGLGSNPALSYNYTLRLVVKTKCWESVAITKFICDGGPKVSPIVPVSPTVNNVVTCIALGAYQISFPGASQIFINGVTVNVGTVASGTGYLVSTTGNVLLNLYNYNYTVNAVNSCGVGSVYIIRLIQQPGCRLVAPTPKSSTINFIVSPNPSTGNEITIAQEISKVQSTSETSTSGEEQPQPQSEAKIEEFTLVLYNKLQIKVRETTLNSLSTTISTEGLPNDVYFLHIISKNGDKVVRQVMIMR